MSISLFLSYKDLVLQCSKYIDEYKESGSIENKSTAVKHYWQLAEYFKQNPYYDIEGTYPVRYMMTALSIFLEL